MDDVFTDTTEVPESLCNCGRGYCPCHGTFHFSREVEIAEEQRRMTLERGTRGGHRVVRKNIEGEQQ